VDGADDVPVTLRRLQLTPLTVGCMCVVLAALVDLGIAHERGMTGDEAFYEKMAAHPARPHSFPYAYRVVIPWMVHVSPFAHVVSWTLIAFIGIGVSAGGLVAILDTLDVDRRLSAWLAVGFTLSPTLLIVLVRHGRSIDPASMLVMVLGCLFIARRQRVALAVTLLVGVGIRESTLFLMPYAYVVWARRPFDAAALRDAALTCALPIAAYLWLRTGIDAVGRSASPSYTEPFIRGRIDLLKGADWTVEIRRLAYTCGPVWLIAPVALRGSSFARRGLVLIALCVASMTYAYDWDRVIFVAAPIFYGAAALVLANRRRLAVATVVTLLALDVGYGVYLQVHGVQHGIDTTTERVPVV
jgi:hypothetical protein